MKYKKSLFIVAAFFSSLALLSAGFSAFTIINSEDEISGDMLVANVLAINYVASGDISNGIKSFKYNEYGFEQETTYSNKTYKYWSKTEDVNLGLYFYVNCARTSSFNISFSVNFKQNNTSLNFINSYYKSAACYGDDSLINLTNSQTLNSATTKNDNSLTTTFTINNLELNAHSNYYFAVNYTFGNFVSSDYSSVKTFLDLGNIFTFSINATASELGGNS